VLPVGAAVVERGEDVAHEGASDEHGHGRHRRVGGVEQDARQEEPLGAAGAGRDRGRHRHRAEPADRLPQRLPAGKPQHHDQDTRDHRRDQAGAQTADAVGRDEDHGRRGAVDDPADTADGLGECLRLLRAHRSSLPAAGRIGACAR